jgi:predicted RNase H-like HicB family nuclease/DNA-binding Xre family transcriptional regulator
MEAVMERLEHVGGTIRHYRRRMGMTQEELARRAGLAPTSIVRLESGEVRAPRLSTLESLAVALQIPVAELVQCVADIKPAHAEASGPFTAVYERTDDGWWVVSVPEIPGAHSQGRTLEEARAMIRDAVRMLLEVRREDADRELEGTEVIREPLTL